MFGRTPRRTPRIDASSLPPPEATLPVRPAFADLAPAAPPLPPRKTSILHADLQIEGVIAGDGELRIDGVVRGGVRVSSLIVGEAGAVEGDVAAEHIEVHGRIVGNLSGREIRLLATAYVEGDIASERLAIDLGAYFQGRVLKTRRDPVSTVQAEPSPALQTTNAPVGTGAE